MTTSTRRARRRPGGGAGSHTLARLAAAREQLDADIVAQRRREDELLAEYAAVADTAAAVAARRDAALADLDRQAAQLRTAADRELSALEAQQGAVLVAMHASRSADSLAKLVGLPVKQVRASCARTVHRRRPARPATAARDRAWRRGRHRRRRRYWRTCSPVPYQRLRRAHATYTPGTTEATHRPLPG